MTDGGAPFMQAAGVLARSLKGMCVSRMMLGGAEQLEQSFLTAISRHHPRHDFLNFFRTVQASLILRKQSTLLNEFRDTLQNMIHDLRHQSEGALDAEAKRLWFLSFADMTVFLINRGHLSKKDMTPASTLLHSPTAD